MKKKPSSGPRPPLSNPGLRITVPNRHSAPEQDLWLHAQTFHKAAKKLVVALELDSGPFTAFDVSPVVFMYRHAVELHLKALVLGEGGNFLATKPDSLSVHKTHSVSWLAQFVCQIITAVKWEKEFRCDGIENLTDFKARHRGTECSRSWLLSIPTSRQRRGQGRYSGPCRPYHS